MLYLTSDLADAAARCGCPRRAHHPTTETKPPTPLLEYFATSRARSPHRWLTHTNPTNTNAWLHTPSTNPTYMMEAIIQGNIGHFNIASSPLLLRIATQEDITSLLIATTTTRQTLHKTHLELGLIASLVKQTHQFGHVEGFVFLNTAQSTHWTRDEEAFLRGQWNVALAPFSQAMEHWLSHLPNHQTLSETPIRWGPWCQGRWADMDLAPCTLVHHCTEELSQAQDIALIPGITPTSRTELKRHGIHRWPQLAMAKQLPQGTSPRMMPNPDIEAQLHDLERLDEPGPSIDIAIQRARRFLRKHALRYRLKAPSSRNSLSLTHGLQQPNPNQYPSMVQILVEIQIDPTSNHAYLFAASLRTPTRHKELLSIIEIVPLRPTLSLERDSLICWLTAIWHKLIQCIPEYQQNSALVHIYTTHPQQMRRLQRLWHQHNKAIQTHLPQLASLLRQREWMAQDAVTYVCEEVEHHLNIPIPSTTMMAMATHLGFQPNHHNNPPTDEIHWTNDLPDTWIHPLWTTQRSEPKQQLHSLVAERLSALGFLIDALPNVGQDGREARSKRPINLKERDGVLEEFNNVHTPATLSGAMIAAHLSRALAIQAIHRSYRRPLAQRLHDGTSLALHFDETLHDKHGGQHRFRLATSGQYYSNSNDVQRRCRWQTGDIIVLTAAKDDGQPWYTRAGWLGRIDECSLTQLPQKTEHNQEERSIVVTGLTWLGKGEKDNPFAWRHQRLSFSQAKTYIASPAADAPKGMRLQKLFVEQAGFKRVEKLLTSDKKVSQSNQWHPETRLSPHQERCISTAYNTRLTQIQGPPGTGKTTTAVAALLRELRTAQEHNTPYRAFITTKHWSHLAPLIRMLQHMLDANETMHQAIFVAERPERTDAPDCPTFRPDLVNRKLYQSKYVLLAGTPSDAYKIHKKRASEEPLFHRILIDNAQQLDVTDGWMAACQLRDDGQLLTTGDHRSLSRAPMHPWQPDANALSDVRLPLMEWVNSQSHSQIEQLHVGYRLPTTATRFFDQHLYWHDFPRPSPTTEGFTPSPSRMKEAQNTQKDGDWTSVVHNAPHPLIMLIHSESDSDQNNAYERELLSALLQNAHEQTGVIVGARQQRELLRQSQPAHTIGIPDDFVGLEKDVIIASTTISAPWAIARELQLIWHPERQQLAWSRHRKKLIVLVSERVFEHPFASAAEHQRVALWHGLKAAATENIATWHIKGYALKCLAAPLDSCEKTGP